MSTRGSGPWWRRRRHDSDFNAEIQAHIDLEVERLTADGVSPADAQQAARRAFGNVLAAEERFYETSRWMVLDQLRLDIRYAFRSLWRSGSFVSTTVLTLAVGLGLLTALFAVLNTYVLRPLAIHDPYRVYEVRWRSPGSGNFMFGVREYEELRERRDLFVDAVAHRWQMVSSQERGLNAAFVSGNYFDMLQPRVRLGRALAGFDARTPGGAAVTVLSDQGWARFFDRDPNVLGRRLDVNGHAFTVVGVMRPEFSGMDDLPLDAWMPFTMYPTVSGQNIFDSAHPQRLTVFARLRPDVSPEQAEQALLPFMVRSAAQSQPARPIAAADVQAQLNIRATPNPISVELIAMLSPVFAAFLLVLVAACANVSNVMLARAIARHREIGIRLSVGASRGRIIRQLLTEALMISALAGLAGLALAAFVLEAGKRVLFATLPASMAELISVLPLQIDYRVFLFALGLAAATTLVFALLPALQATRLTLTDALRGQPAPGVRNGALRGLLVAGQVTVSLVLLIAAATLARNGVSIASTDLGLQTQGVFSINQRAEGSAFIPAAAQMLSTDPRAGQIAVTSQNPLFGRFPTMAVKPGAPADATMTTSYVFVSPEYFPVLRIPLLRGRTFTATEAQAEARVGIVSDRAAKAFWPGRDPVGQTLRIATPADQPDEALTGYAEVLIVGVARDVVSGFVYDGTDTALVYLPTSRTGTHAGALLVRGEEAGDRQRDRLQQALLRANTDRQVFEILPLGDMTTIMLYPLRAASGIGSLLGLVALVLSVSGLYGVLTYILGQRTREIGIRMALGATATGVVRLVMRQSARVVGIGAAIGLVFAFASLKLLASMVTLKNVSLLDGWSFAIGLVLIAAAAVLATYFPARRATQVDPCQTLRADA